MRKINWRNVFFILFAALVVAFIFTARSCSSYKSQLTTAEDNTRALTEKVKAYRLADSTSVALVGSLTIQRDDFKEMYTEVVEECENLGIKLKNVQQYSKTVSENRITVHDTIRDSLIIENNHLDTIRCVEFHDSWTDFTGCEKDGRFTGNIESRDTLTTILHYSYDHKFLFFRWGKRLKQTIHSSNPHNTIQYQENVIIHN